MYTIRCTLTAVRYTTYTVGRAMYGVTWYINLESFYFCELFKKKVYLYLVGCYVYYNIRLYDVYYDTSTVQCTVSNVECTLYTAHCHYIRILYTVQRTD